MDEGILADLAINTDKDGLLSPTSPPVRYGAQRNEETQHLLRPALAIPQDARTDRQRSFGGVHPACNPSSPLSRIDKFFSLPREMRDEIYQYVLAGPRYLVILRFKGQSDAVGTYRIHSLPNHTALLYVCRQTSLEARRILYRQHAFSAVHPNEGRLLDCFARTVGPTNAAFVTTMRIRLPELYLYPSEESIKKALKDGKPFREATARYMNELAMLRTFCDRFPGLLRLELHVDRSNCRSLTDDNTAAVQAFLQKMDTCLKALPDLHRVILIVDEQFQLAPEIRETIRGLGWRACPHRLNWDTT